MHHIQSQPISVAAVPSPARRSRAFKLAHNGLGSGPTTPIRSSPVLIEKRHHQLPPSVGMTIPLQIKLITQLLMVSTPNTSRSNTNPPRMQDSSGDADSRLIGTLEAMQANTSEVEALRLANQRLIGELEQLTRQIQRPRDT